MFGISGVGKTHLAVPMAICACHHGPVYFTALDMTRRRAAAELVGKPDQKLRTYATKSKLLIVDEVGYLPLTRAEANYLSQVVSYRYGRSSVILTSNKSVTG